MLKRLGLLVAAVAVILLPAGPVAADVQDFTIESFEADYLITRDANNVSQLYVREEIVAVFPDFDQNHGILRAIPETYQGHSVELSIDQVIGKDATPYAYETYSENDNTVLKIGDADTYVHGKQTYIIDYHLRGVTLNFDDHDEFYWDINGDQWQQPFGKVAVRVHVDDPARGTVPASAFTADAVCYTGTTGSTLQDCRAERDENGISFATTRQLGAGEALTIVVGFTKGTFVAYQPSPELIMRWVLAGLAVALPALLALWLVIRNWRKYGRDPSGRGTIVPEYIPPKDLSVLESDMVVKERFVSKAVSATIIDLAVRHFIRVYEVRDYVVKDKPTLKKPDDYKLELIKPTTHLRDDELDVVMMLFGNTPTVGSIVALKDLATKLAVKAQKLGGSVGSALATKQYFRVAPQKAKLPYIIWGSILVVLGFVFFPFTLGLALAGFILMIASNAMPARTAKGVGARDYLYGLRDYMKLAEADRLKVLQSPHGELTEKVNVDDKRQLVKLYERLLPYAMLFGIEKDWAKQFEHLYTEEPSWYRGSGAFHAAYFASSIGGFSTASAATFAPPSSSSGSGFSGGSSGGGGGGGGGGGW